MIPPDTLLIMLLTGIAASAVPIIAWFRAQKRIRHLEMTLLAQTTDVDRFEELRTLVQHLAAQTEQLTDAHEQLTRRLSDWPDRLLPPPAEHQRPVTPH